MLDFTFSLAVSGLDAPKIQTAFTFESTAFISGRIGFSVELL